MRIHRAQRDERVILDPRPPAVIRGLMLDHEVKRLNWRAHHATKPS